MRPQAEMRSIHLAFERDDASEGRRHLFVVEGDGERLRQLMLILLDNAIRYTPAGGMVTVTAVHRSGHVQVVRHGEQIALTVRDTGIGIAPEDLPRIFEPFYRASSTTDSGEPPTEERHGSAGLGLALAHWIVAAHRGDLDAESEVGVGSVFTVTLPAVSTSRSTAEHEKAARDNSV
jgi:signal transduction histidine kinase